MSLVPPALWPIQLRLPDQPSGWFNLADHILKHPDPSRVAIATSGMTYGALDRMSSRMAALLVKLGLTKGDRVLLHLPNSVEFIASWFGVLRAGGINVAAMPLLRARELEFMLRNSGARIAIGHARLWPELARAIEGVPGVVAVAAGGDVGPGALCFEQLLEESVEEFATMRTDAEDLALIAFTSGSTGAPKGCAHSHGDIVASISTYCRQVLAPRRDDVFVGNPSMAFTYGLGVQVLFPFASGAATTIVPEPTVESLVSTLVASRATLLFTVPITYKSMLKMSDVELRKSTATLRLCVSAGERLPAAVYREWLARTGVELIEGLGTTELFHIVIASRPGRVRPGATGQAVPGYVCRVVDGSFRDVAPGATGLLAVQGPTRCRYWDNVEKQRLYVQNGWNVPGDLYILDEDGYLWYQARNDDLVVTAGYNVSPAEVEEILIHHPSVKDAAVIGKPDALRGQLVKAFVELAPGFPASPELTRELQELVKREVAPYKYPREIEYVTGLPLTETGKVSRSRLRALELERTADPKAG